MLATNGQIHANVGSQIEDFQQNYHRIVIRRAVLAITFKTCILLTILAILLRLKTQDAASMVATSRIRARKSMWARILHFLNDLRVYEY